MNKPACVNNRRRKFLTWTTGIVGAAGAAGIAVPFIASWNPSERAKAAGAPVEVDLSTIPEGMLVTVEWQRKPIWVVRRKAETVNALAAHDDQLKDPTSEKSKQPDYVNLKTRAIRDDIFVAVGSCTHLGCIPKHIPDEFEGHVQGVRSGFFCPCHGSKFDMAGRVFKGVPAGTNLVVPPYTFSDENTLIVGIDSVEV